MPNPHTFTGDPEIGRLVTQERDIKQAEMDENHTIMANIKG